jgi:hypothetical protein
MSAGSQARRNPAGRDARMNLCDETTVGVRALAARTRTPENVLFCALADRAIRTLKRLIDTKQGYEAALQSVAAAGSKASEWLRAVVLAPSLETLPPSR